VASQLSSSHVVSFADFELDLRSGELSRNGTSLKLQPQPAKVLVLLVSRHGEIVTRQDIARQVWGSETFVDFEQGLNFAIRKIRSVLHDDADHPRFLETLPKRGYRFTAPVKSHPPLSEVAAPAAVSPRTPSPKRRALRYGLAGLAVGVVVALFLAWHWGLFRQLRSRALRLPRIESLAVLPLRNLSRDPEQEYFSDGMTDELITELARFGTFRVISHTSVERYKDTKRPLPEIAHELGVDAIVEGTVMRSGDRVRITSQLIEARSDRHLWAESYDRDLSNVLALQNEVARDIATEIQIKVQERSPQVSVHSINPEAHETYLKGRYFWNKRTGDGVRKGIEYFDQATRLDPNYAAAYAGLAESYVVLNGHRFLPPTQAFPKVRVAALKALELDEGLAEAHASLGALKWEYDWDPSGAEKEFRRAIELNPSYATAHQWYAEELAIIGRGDEALAEIQRAKQLDPVSLPRDLLRGSIRYILRG
jgi:TolB-like protein/DNA-binding winged helix-turn-helix (wHTH) protein